MNISSNFNSGLIFSYLNEKEDANFYQILHLIASESLPIEVGHQKDSASFSFADLLDHISNVLLVISISQVLTIILLPFDTLTCSTWKWFCSSGLRTRTRSKSSRWPICRPPWMFCVYAEYGKHQGKVECEVRDKFGKILLVMILLPWYAVVVM